MEITAKPSLKPGEEDSSCKLGRCSGLGSEPSEAKAASKVHIILMYDRHSAVCE